MGSWRRGVFAVVVVLTMATGCGSGGASGRAATSISPTPSSIAPAPFDAVVALSDFSATCREVTCWLPTQFAPKLVRGETVSLRDKWPMDGMAVRVVCETTGEIYRDQSGQDTDAWYGIRIPADKLEPSKPGRSPKMLPGGDGIGYVGVAWIKGGSGKQAPAC